MNTTKHFVIKNEKRQRIVSSFILVFILTIFNISISSSFANLDIENIMIIAEEEIENDLEEKLKNLFAEEDFPLLSSDFTNSDLSKTSLYCSKSVDLISAYYSKMPKPPPDFS